MYMYQTMLHWSGQTWSNEHRMSRCNIFKSPLLCLALLWYFTIFTGFLSDIRTNPVKIAKIPYKPCKMVGAGGGGLIARGSKIVTPANGDLPLLTISLLWVPLTPNSILETRRLPHRHRISFSKSTVSLLNKIYKEKISYVFSKTTHQRMWCKGYSLFSPPTSEVAGR